MTRQLVMTVPLPSCGKVAGVVRPTNEHRVEGRALRRRSRHPSGLRVAAFAFAAFAACVHSEPASRTRSDDPTALPPPFSWLDVGACERSTATAELGEPAGLFEGGRIAVHRVSFAHDRYEPCTAKEGSPAQCNLVLEFDESDRLLRWSLPDADPFGLARLRVGATTRADSILVAGPPVIEFEGRVSCHVLAWRVLPGLERFRASSPTSYSAPDAEGIRILATGAWFWTVVLCFDERGILAKVHGR